MCDLDFADFSHFCEKMQFSSFSAIFRQVSIKQTITDSDICQVDLELFLLGEMCLKKVLKIPKIPHSEFSNAEKWSKLTKIVRMQFKT